MRKKLLLYLLAIPLFSCQSEQGSKELNEKTVSERNQLIQNLKKENDSLKQEINDTPKIGVDNNKNEKINPQYDKLLKNENPTKDIQILIPGKFWYGYFNDDVKKLEWYGIFQQKDTFIIKKTNLILEPTSWGDEKEGGKFVTTTIGMGTPIIFIAGLKDAQEGKIQSIKLEKATLNPGEVMLLKFNGWEIFFGAYGTIIPYGDILDYLLEIRSHRKLPKNESKQQIFAGGANLKYDTYSFYWAGDIDRDGLLDLIMALYSDGGNRIELFLSSKAENGQLIKKVAEFSYKDYIGC
ncbi:MAG: hypothetical protein HYY40_03220 [Bacteroidetes bacterium]|nr:hypothetical protein [Bacteroidota bacterium]